MYVKQIDQKKALELVEKGLEVKVLVPGDVKNSWEYMMPDTLQQVLDRMLFFRTEPAMEKSEFEELGERQPPPNPKQANTKGGYRKDAGIKKSRLEHEEDS